MEEIEKLHLKVAKCNKCSSIEHYRKFPPNAHGNIHSKNMIISEAPAGVSLDKNRFWTGNGGVLLRDCISMVGKDLERNFYITDVVKCWPNIDGRRNRNPKLQEVENCRQFVIKEIEMLKPKNIFLFGKIAAALILGKGFRMKDYHGKSLEFENGIRVYIFYHPSYIVRQKNASKENEYKQLLINTFNHGPATS